jgi:hypothetical protein
MTNRPTEEFAGARTEGHVHREVAYCVAELLTTSQETIRLQTGIIVAQVKRIEEDVFRASTYPRQLDSKSEGAERPPTDSNR